MGEATSVWIRQQTSVQVFDVNLAVVFLKSIHTLAFPFQNDYVTEVNNIKMALIKASNWNAPGWLKREFKRTQI